MNLFEKLKRNIEENRKIENFMEEISNFLKDINKEDNCIDESIEKIDENKVEVDEILVEEKNNKLSENRKEGHLYLVTEDRNNEVYLWDFTDKPKKEFVEKDFSEDLLKVAKEGAMLQYINGKYELYSTDGYDMLYNEENKE